MRSASHVSAQRSAPSWYAMASTAQSPWHTVAFKPHPAFAAAIEASIASPAAAGRSTASAGAATPAMGVPMTKWFTSACQPPAEPAL